MPLMGAMCAACEYRPRNRNSPVTSAIRAEPLDRDVIQVVGPVDGGPGVRLGQHQPLGRILGPAQDLSRHLAHGLPALPGVAEDAEPGARHGAQAGALLGRHDVVFAVTEEGEVAVRQPAEQVTMLGLVAAGLPAQVIGQPAGHRTHPRLIFGRHPYVVEHVAQVGRELIGGHLVPGRTELDVDPGLGQLAAARLVLVTCHRRRPGCRAAHRSRPGAPAAAGARAAGSRPRAGSVRW